MLRQSDTFQKVQTLYGIPSGFSEERRKVFYNIEKSAVEVTRELNDVLGINSAEKVYIFSNGNATIVAMDA